MESDSADYPDKKSELPMHVTMHTGTKIYKCDICNQDCTNKLHHYILCTWKFTQKGSLSFTNANNVRSLEDIKIA